MDGKIETFKDLKIWQKGIEIVNEVYSLTKQFPKEEMYGLTAQMRRSAVSIPSNVAEGFKRYHNKEYKQFLYVAQGSSAELETQLIIAKNLNYAKQNDVERMGELIDHLSRMITSLIKKLS